jgi:hypothetical protein
LANPKADSSLLLSVFVAVEGAHAFSAFMPSYFTVKKFAEGEEDLRRIRSGYAPAILFNLALGGVVSGLTGDRRPFLFAIVVIGAMMALYEGALRGD